METKLMQLLIALCDEENQPHQWMGDPAGLEKQVLDAMGCQHPAEWELHQDDPYLNSYCCTQHLPFIVEKNVTSITPHDGNEKCCFLGRAD